MIKMKKRFFPVLLSAAVLGGTVFSQIYSFASSPSATVNIEESGTAYRGDEVTINVRADIYCDADVAGLQIDFGYSSNFPDVTTSITTDTTGWLLKPSFVRKNIAGAALGVVLSEDAVVEGEMTFTVPEDATIGEEYTVSLTYVEVTDAGGYILDDYELINDSVTITVIDFPDIEGVSVGDYFGEYDGEEHSLDVTIPGDASISYGTEPGEYNLSSLSYKDAGQYTVYYQITQDKHKTITGTGFIEIDQKMLSFEMIGDINPQTYTGSQITPAVTVSDGSSNIISESDYTVSYGEKINAGEGTVTVTATADGNYYGEATKTFTINKANMNYNIGGCNVTYDGTEHTGYLNVDAANPTFSYGLIEGTYDLDTMPSFTDAGTYNVYCKATADNYNDFTGVFTVVINPKELTENMVSDVSDVSYTGSRIMPEVSVSDGNLLTADDYAIGYGDNTNVADGGSVTVTGQNNYTGEVTKTFNILPIDFAEGEITAADYSGTYDGAAHSGSVSTTVSGVEITYGESAGSFDLTSAPAYTNAGTYTVYFKASEPNRNDYTGSFTVTIAQKELTEAMITGIASATYTGSQLTPEVTVADGSPSIISADDYTLSYGTNVTVAEGGSVTITGKGNYTGTITKTFAIARADMTVSADDYSGTYDGTAHCASVSVSVPTSAAVSYGTAAGTYDLTAMPIYTNAGTYTVYYTASDDNYNTVNGSVTVTISPKEVTSDMIGAVGDMSYTGSQLTPAVTVTDGTTALAEGTDYTVGYGENINVSTGGTVSITGAGNYTGTASKSFNILPIDFAEREITASDYSGTYDGAAHSGSVSTTVSTAVITYGESAESCTLTSIPAYTKAGTYTVYYSVNDTNHNAAAGSFTVTITAKALTEDMVSAISAVTYTGSQLTPSVTVTDGTVLAENTDYTVSYGTNVTVAEGGSVTITGVGNYIGTITKAFEIARADMTVSAENYSGTYDGSAHSASVSVSVPSSAAVSYGTAEGAYDLTAMPSYTNAGTYTVYYTASDDNYNTVNGSVTVTISPKEVTSDMIGAVGDISYTGSQLTPSVYVTDGNAILTEGTDYTVGYGENINVSTGGTVSITGAGNYTGTASKAFNILPIDFAEGEITASSYEGIYDGAAHSGAVSSTVSTAVITYGESADSCTLTSVPAYTNVGTYIVYYSVSDTNHNTASGSFTVTITAKALTEDMVSAVSAVTYTGSQLTPAVTVTDGSVLAENTDYTLSYGTNITVAEGGSVTITGTGNYTGSVTKAFAISKADMTVSAENYSGTYDGSAHYASVSVSVPSSAAVSYGTAEGTYDLTAMPSFTNAGTYTVYYTASDDNYNTVNGSVTITISPKEVTSDMIGDIEAVTYTGSQLTPSVYVTDGNAILTESDYTVGYGENVNVSTGGTVSITGTGNYTGTASKAFTISKAVLTASAESLTITYGETPEITVSYTGFVGSDTEEVIKTQAAAEGLSEKLSAGTYSIVLSGAAADNYDFTYSTDAVLTVNKKSVTITSLSAAEKTYDGTVSGEIDPDSVVLEGVVSGDDVSVEASSVVFDSAEIGSDIAVVISGITLTGADADNYSLSVTSYSTTGTIVEAAAETTTEETTVKKSSSGGGGGSGVVLYTVKFETNGGSTIADKSVSKNTSLQTVLKNLADPEKEGDTFEGWYTDEDLTEAVDLSAKVSANMTLYAKWADGSSAETTEETVEATTEEEAAAETETTDNRIIMTIDSVAVSIFGTDSEIDVPPVIVNERTMLPARFVLESLGAELGWDAAEKKVTITKDDMEVIIYIGSETAYINGEAVTLDSPAFISNERTYLPVRFISESIGANVEWNEAERQVIITP